MNNKLIEQTAEKRIEYLERSGILGKASQTMAAAYLLTQIADRLFFAVQDELLRYGFIHQELKRNWNSMVHSRDKTMKVYEREFINTEKQRNDLYLRLRIVLSAYLRTAANRKGGCLLLRNGGAGGLLARKTGLRKTYGHQHTHFQGGFRYGLCCCKARRALKARIPEPDYRTCGSARTTETGFRSGGCSLCRQSVTQQTPYR